MGAALRFKHTDVPRQQGEQARLKVVRGPDQGAVYVVTGNTASIGRGDENDIVISDIKASRVHAQIMLTSVGWSVKDMGSANGIILNGKSVRDGKLATSDVVTVGETALEFMGNEVNTKLLKRPAQELSTPNKSASILKFPISPRADAGASGRKPSPLLLIVVAGAGAFLLLGGEDSKKPASEPSKTAKSEESAEARNLASYLQGLAGSEPPEIVKSADLFFKQGFREYKSRNFIRARMSFETVLQMSPGHPLATLYLQNVNKEIEDEIKQHLQQGKQSMIGGKLRQAKGHYEQVMRLLYRDTTAAAYLEAKDQLEKVQTLIRQGDS